MVDAKSLTLKEFQLELAKPCYERNPYGFCESQVGKRNPLNRCEATRLMQSKKYLREPSPYRNPNPIVRHKKI
jgi:hypothetical protein